MPGGLRLSVAPLLAVAVIAVACGGGGGGESGGAPPTAAPAPTVAATAPAAGQPAPSLGGRVVRIENQDKGGSGVYQFVPSELDFKVGDTVTFEITAETEFHTFTVDDLGIDVSLEAGETVSHTYTFDKAGSFKLLCIPHETFGMTGTITVAP